MYADVTFQGNATLSYEPIIPHHGTLKKPISAEIVPKKIIIEKRQDAAHRQALLTA
jgi:hypothetical protein